MIVLLQSSDGATFTVSKDAADMSTLIKNMIEGERARRLLIPTFLVLGLRRRDLDLGEVPESPIPLPNVNSEILQKVTFCETG